MVEFKRLERQIILKSLGAIIHKKSDIHFQFQDIYLILKLQLHINTDIISCFQ